MTPAKMKIAITVINAYNLSKSFRFRIKTPTCFAEITVDGEEPQQTIPVKSTNPQWNATFEFEVKESSTVKISILYHESNRSSIHNLRGEVSLPVEDLTMDVETTYALQKDGKSGRHGFVVLRVRSLASVSPTDRVTDLETSGEYPNNATSVPESQPQPQRLAPSLSEPHEGLISAEMETAKDEVDGMVNFDSFDAVCGYVKIVVTFGAALSEVHPYAKMAWKILTIVPETFTAQLERDKKTQEVWSTAADMLDFLKDANEVIIDTLKITPGLTEIVAAMMKQIYDCASFLREYAGKGFLRQSSVQSNTSAKEILSPIGRALRDTLNTASDNTLEEFASSFRTLKERFQSRSALTVWKIVRQIQDGTVQFGSAIGVMKDIEQLKVIEDLPGAKLSDVRWDLGNVCLPNTRQRLLDEIVSWIDNPEEGSMFWLHGVAGSGKSTIGNTIAKIFADLGRLAGSFRFHRDVQGCNVPTYFFGNLAYQLAHFNGQLLGNVVAAIKVHGNMSQWPLRNQMKTFIVDVLKDVEFAGPIVILIDGLDECEGESARNPLLESIVTESQNIPRFVKFLIISRDEADIQSKLETICTSRSINTEEDTQEDIIKFIDHRMAQIQRAYDLPTGWPDEASRYKLAWHSAGLFIWAAIACKYIEGVDPAVQLDEMLSGDIPEQSNAETTLDNLYLDILQRVCTNISDDIFKYVVGSILLVKTPLTQPALDSLLGLGSHTIDHPLILSGGTKIKCTSSGLIIRRLRSILQSCLCHDSIRILHPSLFDFLTNSHRCTNLQFFIDTPSQNMHLAFRCFAVMDSLLKRDICGINDPTKLNYEVTDLDHRLEGNVPEHLIYACLYWVQHLTDLPDDSSGLYNKVRAFLFLHLLHWLEVMSLLNMIDAAFAMLQSVKHWFQGHHRPASDDVNHLINDALRFVQYFRVPIEQSAAQIYVSAIPFTPAETILSKTFSPRLECIPRVRSGLSTTWSPCVAVLEGTARYNPVAISPDGSHVAFALSRRMVQIWDLATGIPIGMPFVASVLDTDSEDIRSINFSQDGNWLITISSFCIVRFWETLTGDLLRSFQVQCFIPLIRDAQLSADKTHINIHSYVNRSIVLDTVTGVDVLQHPDCGVYPMRQEMSPDGRTIVCLYNDGTIRKFSDGSGDGVVMEEGTRELEVLDLSDPPFLNLSPFSPDGMRLVSYTSTGLKIWDSTTATAIVEILVEEEEHFISFSPNGRQFLSSTFYGHGISNSCYTIHLREVQTGTDVGQPLESHKQNIVLFSPDGTRFAYASTKQTIEVLDTNSGIVVRCLDHADQITAMAFSEDGGQIASAHEDGTIKLWDLLGSLSNGTTQHNQQHVETLAFSQDGRRVVSADGTTACIWDVSLIAASSHVSEDSSYIMLVQPSMASPWFLSVCNDNTILVWDTTENSPVCQFHEHTEQIISTAFSPQGQYVVSSSEDKIAWLWDALTGQAIAPVLKGNAISPQVFSFSPSGNQIVLVAEDNMLCIWDIRKGDCAQVPLKEPTYDIKSIAFSPDEKQFISVSENYIVRFFDVSSGILIRSWGPWMSPLSAALTRDNGCIFSISGDGRFHIWNACMGTMVEHPVAGHSLYAQTVVYSEDKSHAACVLEENAVCVSDDATGASVGPPLKHSVGVRSILLSSDGARVASVSTGGAIRIWDTVTGVILAEILNAWNNCGLVAFSPDGRYLAFCGNYGLQKCQIYDTVIKTLKPLGGHPYDTQFSSSILSSLAFSSDGSQVVCTYIDNTIVIHNAASASIISQKVGSLDFLTKSDTNIIDASTGNSVPALPYVQSSDHTRSAYLHCSQMLWITDTSTGMTANCFIDGGTSSVTLPTFSTDGSRIACVAGGCKIYVWNVVTGACITGPLNHPGDGKIISLALPNNGQHIVSVFRFSTSNNTDIACIWDVVKGVPQEHLLDYQTDHSIHLSQDGTRIVITNNNHMEMWDAMLGTKIFDFQGSTNSDKIVFSPDGSQLLSINKYNTICLWDATTGALINVLSAGRNLCHCGACIFPQTHPIFSPDGTKVASWVNTWPGIHLWDGKTGIYMYRLLSGITNLLNIRSLTFSPSSTQILCESTFNNKNGMEIWDIKDLPHSITSTSDYPAKTMMVCHIDVCMSDDGWFWGENGARLFWVPPRERGIWFLSPQHKAILGRDQHKVVIVDIEEYLKLSQVRRSWRENGVQYTQNQQDVILARVLAEML